LQVTWSIKNTIEQTLCPAMPAMSATPVKSTLARSTFFGRQFVVGVRKQRTSCSINHSATAAWAATSCSFASSSACSSSAAAVVDDKGSVKACALLHSGSAYSAYSAERRLLRQRPLPPQSEGPLMAASALRRRCARLPLADVQRAQQAGFEQQSGPFAARSASSAWMSTQAFRSSVVAIRSRQASITASHFTVR